MGKSRPFWKFEHVQVLEFAKRSRVRVRLGGASPDLWLRAVALHGKTSPPMV